MSSIKIVIARFVTSLPAFAQRGFLALISFLSRMCGQRVGVRLYSLANAITWKFECAGVKQVRVGQQSVWIHSHTEEFDFQASFFTNIPYEKEVFGWLDTHLHNYDVVIEIGANVGVFACYFEQATRVRGTNLKRVYCFEPSRKAFARLLANLHVNNSQVAKPFNCAVGTETQWIQFYEPTGHLTNGSLVKSFSEKFSARVGETLVLSVGPAQILDLVAHDEKVLLKIDVEGYEPVLLTSLQPFLKMHKPDVIIEVLPETSLEIEDSLKGVEFKRFHIREDGIKESSELLPHSYARDWLFRFE